MDDLFIESSTFESADELYLCAIHQVLRHGHWVGSVRDADSIGSHFGRRSRRFLELSPFVARLENGRARWISNSVRRVSFVNAVGLFLWTLSGSDKVEDIEFYNESAGAFSDDGVSLWGALGKRILGARNPLFSIIRRLAADPLSRRAILPVFAAKDTWTLSKDIPCLLSIQFLVRERKLNVIATLRSNDALMVLPYDLFVATMLQELVASVLDLGVGTYTHVSNSMHIYEDQISVAERVIRSELPPSLAMPGMPKTTRRLIRDISRAECQMRLHAEIDSAVARRIPPYWHNLLTVTAIRRAVLNHKESQAFRLIDELDEPFVSMIRNDRRVARNWEAQATHKVQ